MLKEKSTNYCYCWSEPWRVLENFFFFTVQRNKYQCMLFLSASVCMCVYVCKWVCVYLTIFLKDRVKSDWLRALLSHILKKVSFIYRVE